MPGAEESTPVGPSCPPRGDGGGAHGLGTRVLLLPVVLQTCTTLSADEEPSPKGTLMKKTLHPSKEVTALQERDPQAMTGSVCVLTGEGQEGREILTQGGRRELKKNEPKSRG